MSNMSMQARQVQRQEQRLALVPRMLQSIEILRLAAVDLEQAVARELCSNEMLEARPVVETGEPVRGVADRGRPRPNGSGEADGKLALLHNLPAREDTLLDHVREQVVWAELSPELEGAVLKLAEQLDARGFLPLTDAELEAQLGSEFWQEAVAVLRSLDPPGIGARDAIGALLLQIEAGDPDRADIELLLTGYLEPLAHNKLPEVARALRCAVGDVQALLDKIRGLDPCPAARFMDLAEPCIRPDVVVREAEGGLEVRVDDADLPDLGINEDYAALLAQGPTEDVRCYLKGKLDAARDLIHAVEQRRRTLARVTAAVMEHQRDFLRDGEAAIRPLRMAQIAEVLQLHTSTISRAVAGKYVQTARGVFPLRAFFDGGRAAQGGKGRRSVQQQLSELVRGEDPTAPLSDDELVRRLAALGAKVARRTVSKYRKELGIPSSWRRRRHA